MLDNKLLLVILLGVLVYLLCECISKKGEKFTVNKVTRMHDGEQQICMPLGPNMESVWCKDENVISTCYDNEECTITCTTDKGEPGNYLPFGEPINKGICIPIKN